MSDEQRVVVTGLGIVTALGPDRESTWSAIRRGRTAVKLVEFSTPTDPDSSRLSLPAAPIAHCLPSGDDPVVQLGLSAAQEAVADAALGNLPLDRSRIACNLSTSKGGLRTLFAEHRRLLDGQTLTAQLIEQVHPGALASAASALFDFRGISTSTVAACATGLHALIGGYHLIHEGRADVVLSGASDASAILPLVTAYDRMGVLSHNRDDPAGAVKPFDRDRDGFAVGEGAAAFVLESLASARARGVHVYAELAGWARGSDAYHLTSLAVETSQIGRLLGQALERADISPDELDYINAHGTATRTNDVLETRAIHEALGESAGRVPVSSIKAATGHLLGAAGAVEAAVTLLAMRDAFLPPTLNLLNPDPECDLDYVPLTGRHRPVASAACLSAGFGGQIGIMVFRRI